VYFAVAKLFVRDGELGSLRSLIWVPSGMALAVLMLRGWQLWPGIALGVFLTVFGSGHSWRAELWIALMDTLDSLTVYYILIHRLRIHTSLDRVRDVVAMFAVMATVSLVFTLIAIGGLELVHALPPGRGGSMWARRWWGHLGADLVIAPVLLTWFTKSVRDGTRSRTFEAMALAFAVIMTCLVVFDRDFTDPIPGSREPYFLMPLLVWAGVRFGPRGASLTASTVGIIAIAGTALGTSPFLYVTDLQSFVAISTVTTLVLSALAFERLQAVRRKSAIQRGALDAIITIDASGNIIDFNPAAEQLFGHREAAVIGHELASVVLPPSYRDEHRRGLRDYNADRDSVIVGNRVRFPALRADGTEFPAEISVTRVAVDGQYVFTGFVRDITAEQNAEKSRQQVQDELARKVRERTAETVEAYGRLARKQEMLRDAQELAHVGSFEIDVDHEHAEWSDELERIYGRGPRTGEERYTSLFESVHRDDRRHVVSVMAVAIADKKPFSIEQRIVRPDGSIRLVQALGRPHVETDGSVHRISGCCQDITERKHAERARDRLGELVESSDDAIIGLALDGTIESWNAAATKIFGYTADYAIGKPAAILVDIPERKELENMLDSVRKGHRPAHYEQVHVRKDGTRFDASVTMSAIIDHRHRVIGLSKVLRDISDRKAMDKQLRASLREKEILLREIYHRVKNNLQVISSLLNMQVNAEPSEAARHGLIESQSRIQSMALVHQLLYQSKDVGRIDFSEYLKSLCARLLQTYRVGDNRITLEVHAEAILVDIDFAIPCGLIVNELVTNALIHAFPDHRQGHIDVTMRREGGFLHLGVEDDGIGLPPAIEIETTHTFGLEIARTLTRQLGGRLELVRDHGTTVVVVVAAPEALQEPPPPEPPRPEAHVH
jgi:PAS domain S-box-containing protein